MEHYSLQALLSIKNQSIAACGRQEWTGVEGCDVGGKLTNVGTEVGHVGG